MKSRYIVLAVLLMVMGLYFYKGHHKKTQSMADSDDVEDTREASVEPATPVVNIAKSASPGISSDQTGTSKIQTPGVLSPSEVSPEIQKKFAQQMVNLEKCLHLNSGNPAPSELRLTPDQVLSQLRGSLGEPSVQLDDWSQFDIVDKTGTKKRVRVDYDYPDGATPTRRLSMYTLNSYGSYEIDNLTNDQSDNPNEAYIESLKEGQRLQQQEKASRIYFAQGEELTISTKNGNLSALSAGKGPYTFNCTNLSEANSECNCLNGQ